MKNSSLRQMGVSGAERSSYDFYRTPEIAVRELLIREKFEGLGWDPASGDGAIAKLNPSMIATDLREGSDVYGQGGVDFLKEIRRVDYIITNPPFSLILEFAQKAVELANKVALLGKIQFLEGKARYLFFKDHPPIRVYVFSKRITCDSRVERSSIMCFCWFIWEREYSGAPNIHWILPGK